MADDDGLAPVVLVADEATGLPADVYLSVLLLSPAKARAAAMLSLFAPTLLAPARDECCRCRKRIPPGRAGRRCPERREAKGG